MSAPALSPRRLPALLAAFVLAGGVLLPAVRVPLLGESSLIEAHGVAAWPLLVLGIAAVALVLFADARLTRLVPAFGVAALAIVAWSAWRMRHGPAGDETNATVGRFVREMVGNVELLWGYTVLGAAAVALVIGGAALGMRERR